jgi:putative cell wall-binding protein
LRGHSRPTPSLHYHRAAGADTGEKLTSRITAVAATLAVVALLTPDVHAEQTATVAGTVTDDGRRPLPGMTVTLAAVDDELAWEAQSGSDGAWSIEGVDPGRYTVAFEDPAGRRLPQWWERRPREAVADVLAVEGGQVRTGINATLSLREIPVTSVAGVNRIATAVATSRRAFPDGAGAVVIASAWSFPDALAAAPLAAREGGPLLLADRRLGAEVRTEIARLGATRAVIVGAVAAVSATVQAELARDGLEVQRIAGDGRYDTAALIARALGLPAGGEVIVVSGDDFADAMAAAPLAAAHAIPILLTEPGRLSADTAAALGELRPAATIVVGGRAAVTDEVVGLLPSPRRVAGPDRSATSVAVAEEILQRDGNLDTVGIATGGDYPDGLTAAPAAARGGGPLLLVDPNPAGSAAVWDFLDRHLGAIGEAVVYGGSEAVPATVRSRVARPYEEWQP